MKNKSQYLIIQILLLLVVSGINKLNVHAQQDSLVRIQDTIKTELIRDTLSFIEKTDSVLLSIKYKRANKYFDNFAYIRALELYTDVYHKHYVSRDLLRKMGTAYFKIRDFKNAETYYAELIEKDSLNADDFLMYSKILKSNSNYMLSDQYLKRYLEMNPEDLQAKQIYEFRDQLKQIKNITRYKIEEVEFNSKYSDFGAVNFGKDIYFSSARDDQKIIRLNYSWKEDPYLDIYKIKEKLSKDGSILIEAEKLKSKVNSFYHDGPLFFSRDGKIMYFTRNNIRFLLPKKDQKGVNHLKIFEAHKQGDNWVNIKELSFNSEDYSCGHPALNEDNSKLYFASDMPGGYGGTDLYYVEKTDSGWTAPVNLGPDINSAADEMFPYIYANGEISFASNGHPGFGGLDLFVAKRIGEEWVVKNMGVPLNSEKDDFSLYLDEKGKEGFFASNRDGGLGDDDIYKVKVLQKINFTLLLKGIVKDIKTKEILADADLLVLKENGERFGTYKTDEKGRFEVQVQADENYKLTTSKETYKDANQSISTFNANNEVKTEILLEKIPVWGVFGLVYHKESKAGVDSVLIAIYEIGGDTLKNFTNHEGRFRRKLRENTDYEISLTKDQYFTRKGAFTTKGRPPGWFDINEFLETELEEIVVNKTIEIPNIYYDLAKWNIRPDAAIELDKVVEFLRDNPSIKIELGSHTDSRGSSSSNQILSQKRAQSAVDYIVSRGIELDRIVAKGYGESKIKNRCKNGVKCSKEEHQENRRTEIRITEF